MMNEYEESELRNLASAFYEVRHSLCCDYCTKQKCQEDKAGKISEKSCLNSIMDYWREILRNKESKNKDNFDYRMMIVKIINDICEAYYNQIRKNKDGTRYRVIISPALFNRVCDYDVDLIQINEYDNYFIMGIPLAKDFTMNGLKWELCIVKISKNYDDKRKERNLNIFLVDEIHK